MRCRYWGLEGPKAGRLGSVRFEGGAQHIVRFIRACRPHRMIVPAAEAVAPDRVVSLIRTLPAGFCRCLNC